jgi:hypothetical protein
MPARILLSLALVFALSVPVHAQRGRQPPPKPEDFNAEGVIEAVGPGRIQMKTKANQTVYVGLVPQTLVRVNGMATLDYLRVGLCAEFTGEVSKTLVVKDKISQLTIFSPTPDMPLGLYPEGAAPSGKGNDFGGDGFSDPPAKGRGGRKGKADAGGADAFGAGDAPTGHKGKGAATSGVQLPGVCTVRGKITGVHGTSLTVSAGKAIKAELDENAEISVSTADLTAASKGDTISVVGKQANKQVLALSVRIEAAQKLAGTAKKGRGKPGIAKAEHVEKGDKPVSKPKAAGKKAGDEPAAPEPAVEPKAEPKPKAKVKPKAKDDDEAPLPG